MTYIVSGGALNSTHSHSSSIIHGHLWWFRSNHVFMYDSMSSTKFKVRMHLPSEIMARFIRESSWPLTSDRWATCRGKPRSQTTIPDASHMDHLMEGHITQSQQRENCKTHDVRNLRNFEIKNRQNDCYDNINTSNSVAWNQNFLGGPKKIYRPRNRLSISGARQQVRKLKRLAVTIT